MITETVPTSLNAELVFHPGRNPFSKMIVLDYYDGPVAGVVETEVGPFRFELRAWDDHQEVRVFSLTALPTDRFQALMETLALGGTPHGAVWVVNSPADEAEADVFEKAITRTIGAATPPEWVVAWHNLAREGLLAVKRLGRDESHRILDENKRDYQNGLLSGESAGQAWFALLGLSR